MKLLGKIIVCMLLVLPVAAYSFDMENIESRGLDTSFQICQSGQQRALKQRGIKVTRDKDDLVRRTLRAYGGDYIRHGDTAAVTLNGRTYRDFTLEIVEGKYLVIKTPDDTFYLGVVNKP